MSTLINLVSCDNGKDVDSPDSLKNHEGIEEVSLSKDSVKDHQLVTQSSLKETNEINYYNDQTALELDANVGSKNTLYSKRSASDGVSKITFTDSHALQKRSCSLVDLRTAYMKARIDDKINMLEKELNISLSKKATSETNLSNDALQKCDFQRIAQLPRGRSFSIDEVKEIALNRLQEELQKVQMEMKLKDETVAKLSKIRDEVGAELEDLTASLFEEANKMVHDANVKRVKAEKLLRETNMKVEVLEGEISALKALVKMSIPQPPKKPATTKFEGMKSLFRPKPLTPPESLPILACPSVSDSLVDPLYNQYFTDWRQTPSVDLDHPFLQNIYEEEITPCLKFANTELSALVLKAIETNCITMESASNKKPFPKHCALMNRPRLCTYVVKLGEDKSEQGYTISTLCRNRIASVCDLFCYLRYIQQGLVKNSLHEVYWEVMEKRKNITLARLGIYSP